MQTLQCLLDDFPGEIHKQYVKKSIQQHHSHEIRNLSSLPKRFSSKHTPSCSQCCFQRHFMLFRWRQHGTSLGIIERHSMLFQRHSVLFSASTASQPRHEKACRCNHSRYDARLKKCRRALMHRLRQTAKELEEIQSMIDLCEIGQPLSHSAGR